MNLVMLEGTIQFPRLLQNKSKPMFVAKVFTHDERVKAYHPIIAFDAKALELAKYPQGTKIKMKGQITYNTKEVNGVKHNFTSIVVGDMKIEGNPAVQSSLTQPLPLNQPNTASVPPKQTISIGQQAKNMPAPDASPDQEDVNFDDIPF